MKFNEKDFETVVKALIACRDCFDDMPKRMEVGEVSCTLADETKSRIQVEIDRAEKVWKKIQAYERA